MLLSLINHLKSNINAFCLPSYLTDIVTDFVNAEGDNTRIKNTKLYNFNLN